MGRGWVNAVREAAGAKKGKLFTKIAKEISVAVKMGGPNADGNARLRSALKDAQKSSMPKDTVDRAIKRGLGGSGEAALEEMMYEGYGPHGVAVLVEALTDNRNRTVQDLRASFVRGGGNLGEAGSVMWMFDRVASIVAKPAKTGADPEEVAIEVGANEVEDTGDGHWHFVANVNDLDMVQSSLEKMGWHIEKGEASYRAKTPVALNETQETDLKDFLDRIEDSDDVKRVHLSI